jgi:hypothetical protein
MVLSSAVAGGRDCAAGGVVRHRFSLTFAANSVIAPDRPSISDPMMKTSLTVVALFFASATLSFSAESKEVQDQVFKLFDADHDGSVSLEEYKSGMKGQMAPERVPTVFKIKDLDGDGKLNRTELFVNPDDILKRDAPKKDDKPAKKK